MKLLFVISIVLIPFYGFSQTSTNIKYVFNKVPVSGRDIRYLDTIAAPGASRVIIYNAVKKWIALNYRSANDVIQLDNKDGGELLVKGILDPGFRMLNSPFKCFHTLLIAFKDEKYRIDLTIYEITTTSTFIDRQSPQYYYNKLSNKNARRLFLDIDKASTDLILSLKKSIAQGDNSW